VIVVVWVIGGLLVAALAVVMAFGGVLGALFAVGAVRVVRCDRCRRYGITSLAQPLRSCLHCRHGRLLHPLAWHYAHAEHVPSKRDV
jgi:hypothetical protein